MDTLSARLEQLARIYYIQIGPLLMVFGVGLHSAPVLAWTAGVLIVLETINKLYHLFRRTEPEAG